MELKTSNIWANRYGDLIKNQEKEESKIKWKIMYSKESIKTFEIVNLIFSMFNDFGSIISLIMIMYYILIYFFRLEN